MEKRRLYILLINVIFFLVFLTITIINYSMNKNSSSLNFWIFMLVTSLLFLCGNGIVTITLLRKRKK